MQLPKKDTTLLNDEPVFKPIRDLQTPYVDRRNSWSKPSHLPAQPSLKPSTTVSLPANHHPPPPSPITPSKPTTAITIPPTHLPPTASPITPSKPTTAITIPPTHLPPTPSPTPTRNLKRSYSSLIEVRLPNPTPPKKDATTSPPHQPANQNPSPSTRPTKRLRTHPSLFPPHNPLTPPFSIRYRRPPPPSEPPISALELKRAAESILRQVDWDIVAEDVASNRKGGVFRKAVRSVLQGGVDALGGGV